VTKDGLTGIYNRRFFEAQLDILEKIARRSQTLLAMIMVDIDHFKEFNTHYGHTGGDTALHTVAQALNQSFTRASDFVAPLRRRRIRDPFHRAIGRKREAFLRGIERKDT